jgi:hypothetical protein
VPNSDFALIGVDLADCSLLHRTSFSLCFAGFEKFHVWWSSAGYHSSNILSWFAFTMSN